VLEGVAYTLREVLDALTPLDLGVRRLAITGGGARSSLWRQITADTLNRTLIHSEADSCLGAAMLAAVGVGRFPNIEAAMGAMGRATQETVPQPEEVAVYERMYHAYCQKRDALFASPWGGTRAGAPDHEQ
jgi:xylulokinase